MTKPKSIFEYLRKLPAAVNKRKEHKREREKARRRRQMERGQLTRHNGVGR